MNVYEGKNIRNVGIVGHGGSGKTSLIAAILFDTSPPKPRGRLQHPQDTNDYNAQ